MFMAIDFRFPDVGEGIHEGDIVKWLVKEGDSVKKDQAIVEVETDKAVVELPSPSDGKILKIHAKAGQKVTVGEILVSIGKTGEKIGKVKQVVAPKPERKSVGVVGELEEAREVSAPVKAVKVSAKPAGNKVLATPRVRALAKKKGIDLQSLSGTGKNRRITEQDVLNAGKEKVQEKPEQLDAPKVVFDSFGRVLNIPLSRVRKTISQNMSLSHKIIPPATAMDEVDVTDLWQVREKEKDRAENTGYKLSLLPFVAKAVLVALKKNPYLNSSLDEARQSVAVKQYYHLGIAVDTFEGLMVIVVKDADKKNILEIAKEMARLSELARTRQIKIEDLKGSSFTITNWGSIGGTFGVPIINYPEGAILGVGRMKEVPAVKDGKIVVRKVLPLSLTFDHRIIDGAQAARFLNTLKEHLEDPALFLVDE